MGVVNLKVLISGVFFRLNACWLSFQAIFVLWSWAHHWHLFLSVFSRKSCLGCNCNEFASIYPSIETKVQSRAPFFNYLISFEQKRTFYNPGIPGFLYPFTNMPAHVTIVSISFTNPHQRLGTMERQHRFIKKKNLSTRLRLLPSSSSNFVQNFLRDPV